MTCTVLSDYLQADMAGQPLFVDELHTIWLTGAGAPEWLGMRCGKGSAAEASAAAALATEALALGFSGDEIRILLSK